MKKYLFFALLTAVGPCVSSDEVDSAYDDGYRKGFEKGVQDTNYKIEKCKKQITCWHEGSAQICTCNPS